MDPDLEADPQATLSLKHLAQACIEKFEHLSQHEATEEFVFFREHSFWASQQSAEFNLWCAKVGVHAEGQKSIDVRLKDVPEICELFLQLLQSLHLDLCDLVNPRPATDDVPTANTCKDVDFQSETSSSSFDSLTSSEASHTAGKLEKTVTPEQKEKKQLRQHIGNTIDRLQGHAARIEHAGARHRRKRIEIYREKERPRQEYEGLKTLGMWKAQEEFKSASATIKERMAESFARRRSRFAYLREHQKKRAIDTTNLPVSSSVLLAQKDDDDEVTTVAPKKAAAKQSNVIAASFPQDQRTLFSATIATKFDLSSGPQTKERAESVRSIALRHPGFPPPPQTRNGRFQCPYCMLDFRDAEAAPGRWSQHVMQDFEPYFCLYGGCKTPFDVPNSFHGLVDHMQSHVPLRHHIDEPHGKHREFGEAEFEDHVKSHGEVSLDIMETMKETSRRKGAFLFDSCPFCGGFPDILEKRFPDPDKIDAQIELRRHIKQHMQEIALFLPPYRSDISGQDDDSKASEATHRRSSHDEIPTAFDDFLSVCTRDECDCKVLSVVPDEELVSDADPLMNIEPEYWLLEHRWTCCLCGNNYSKDQADLAKCTYGRCNSHKQCGRCASYRRGLGELEEWSRLLGDPAIFDRSEVPDTDLMYNKRLRTFVLRFAIQKCGEQKYSVGELMESMSAHDLTAPGLASMNGLDVILSYFIRLGANVNGTESQGKTLLSLAAENNRVSTINLLMDLGAKIDHHNAHCSTPLSIGAAKGYTEIVWNLLNNGAEPNLQDVQGRTALWSAAERGYRDIVEVLLKHFADVNLRDQHGRTPLFRAAEFGRTEVLKLLLDRGAYLNFQDVQGRTALFSAVERGYRDIVEVLLEAGANVNLRDQHGKTLLFRAVECGNAEVSMLLLQAGAHSWIPNNTGQTPSMVALQNHHDSLAQLLSPLVGYGLGRIKYEESESIILPGNSDDLNDRLDAFFVPSDPPRVFEEADIEKVADLLELMNHGPARSSSPRTYIVLRTIGCLEHLDQILDLGFNDFWFPVDLGALPDSLPHSVKISIMKHQHIVFTSPQCLDNMRHCHILREEDLPFTTISFLGRGRSADVYRIAIKISEREYALKSWRRPRQFKHLKRTMDLFLTEVNIMKRLKNQHFVQYIGSYTTVRSLDLIMTPVADCTLAEYMEELGTTASDSTLQSFFGCLATSIAYLHTNRIKHGCIKPNDILIHRSSVFIADFEDSLDFSDVDVSYIEEGPDPIAPRYASPEIAAMEAPGTPADIWALGCVFLEMAFAFKRRNREWLREYYQERFTMSSQYHANPEATNELLQQLETSNDRSQEMQGTWIRSMLCIDPHLRPTAVQLVSMMHQSNVPAFWGPCCARSSKDPFLNVDSERETGLSVDINNSSRYRTQVRSLTTPRRAKYEDQSDDLPVFEGDTDEVLQLDPTTDANKIPEPVSDLPMEEREAWRGRPYTGSLGVPTPRHLDPLRPDFIRDSGDRQSLVLRKARHDTHGRARASSLGSERLPADLFKMEEDTLDTESRTNPPAAHKSPSKDPATIGVSSSSNTQTTYYPDQAPRFVIGDLVRMAFRFNTDDLMRVRWVQHRIANVRRGDNSGLWMYQLELPDESRSRRRLYERGRWFPEAKLRPL